MMGQAAKQSLVQNPQMQNNPLAMMQEFNKFRRSITPEGAKQRVQELLQSGQMSQQQFEQLQQQAQTFAQFLK